LDLLNGGEAKRKLFDTVKTMFSIMVGRHNFSFDVQSSDHEPEFFFIQNKVEVQLDEAPGGVIEALMISAALFGSPSQTVILDEPGRTMHPQMLTHFVDVLTRTQKSLLFTTHLPHLITRDLFTHIVRCKRTSLEEPTKVTYLANYKVQENGKKILSSPNIAKMFFASGVIWVEGDHDVIFFQCLKLLCERGLLGRPPSNLFYDVIKVDGKESLPQCVNACHYMGVPFVVVADFDNIVPNLISKKPDRYQEIEKLLKQIDPDIEKMKPETAKQKLEVLCKIRKEHNQLKLHFITSSFTKPDFEKSPIMNAVNALPVGQIEREKRSKLRISFNNAQNFEELSTLCTAFGVFTWISKGSQSHGDMEAVMCQFDPNFTKKMWKSKGFTHFHDLIEEKYRLEKVDDIERLLDFIQDQGALLPVVKKKHQLTSDQDSPYDPSKKKKLDMDDDIIDE
jgi:hypothetical protein